MRLIKRGAEAELYRTTWHGRDVVVKHRVRKEYRLDELDAELRTSRTRMEARLMHRARTLGVSVPIIFDVDQKQHKLTMQFIDGPQAKEALNDLSNDGRAELARDMGRSVAALHKGGLVHGDLTTSNILVSGGRLYFIDFSLGAKTSEIEAVGTDLHLLKEAFASTHSEQPELFQAVLEGYREAHPDAEAVIAKVAEIEGRGRYS